MDGLPIIEETPTEQEVGSKKLEQLLMNLLSERDKLAQKYKESQDELKVVSDRLRDTQSDKVVLVHQLRTLVPEYTDDMLEEIKENSGPVINGTSSKLWPLAEEFGELMKELRATKEVLVEKEEEVKDLISERNNTRLLLEHLECLVSRHERSLRMTVRRQTTTAGMSSEEEVLKALKSLFEHHKALDEKVRERLRTALERNSILEDELLLANQDIKALQDELDRFRRRFKERSRSSVRLSLSLEDRGFSIDQLALLGEKEQEIDDLQFQLDELTAKLEETCGVRDEYDKRVAILEEEVAMLMKDLHKDHNAQQLAKQKMEEIEEFKSKMESTVMELKSKLSDSCNALTHLQDENKVLRDKIAEKETKNIKLEDVVLDLQASLDERVCEVHHFEAEVRHWERRHSEELLKCEEKTDNAEQRIRELEVDLDAKGRELASYQEKLHMKENHIARLSSTVDRMLKESNEWMKMAAEEKKSLLDEKKLYSDKFTTTNRKLAKQKAISQNLQEQLELLKIENSSLMRRVPSGTSLHRLTPRLRTSWQETDIDSAIAEADGGTSNGRHISSVHRSSPVKGGPTRSYWSPREINRLHGYHDNHRRANSVDPAVFLHQGSDDMRVYLQELEDQLLDLSTSNLPPTAAGGSKNNLLTPEDAAFNNILESMAVGDFLRAAVSPLPSPSVTMVFNTPSTNGETSDMGEDITATTHRSSDGENLSRSSESLENTRESIKTKFRSKTGSVGKVLGRFIQKSLKVSRRRSVPGSYGSKPQEWELMDLTLTKEGRSEDIRNEDTKILKLQQFEDITKKQIPFSQWDSHMIVTWLEVSVIVPGSFLELCRGKNGQMLLSLSEAEMEQELGLENPLHRLKLRLATQEMDNLTSGRTSGVISKPFTVSSGLDYKWISQYWIHSLGLPQYSDVFQECLVDSRMLDHLTKKHLRGVLKMLDSTHRHSFHYGVVVLKKVNYSVEDLEEKRRSITIDDISGDVLYWSNNHMIQWVDFIGLSEYASNLKCSGVHGGVVAMDDYFSHDELILALQIPHSAQEARKRLKTEFTALLARGTQRDLPPESSPTIRIVRSLSKRFKKRKSFTELIAQPSSTTLQQSSTSPQPLSTTPQPSSTSPQPSSTSPQPSSTTPQPSSTTPQPSLTSPQPSSTTPQSSSTTPQPSSTSPQPSSTTPQPSTSSQLANRQLSSTSPQPSNRQPLSQQTLPQQSPLHFNADHTPSQQTILQRPEDGGSLTQSTSPHVLMSHSPSPPTSRSHKSITLKQNPTDFASFSC